MASPSGAFCLDDIHVGPGLAFEQAALRLTVPRSVVETGGDGDVHLLMASLAYREKVVRAWLDPIENAFTTFGIWAIIIIVRLFLSFFLLFVS